MRPLKECFGDRTPRQMISPSAEGRPSSLLSFIDDYWPTVDNQPSRTCGLKLRQLECLRFCMSWVVPHLGEGGASVEYDSVRTRTSLLSRLRNVDDDASWRTFFDTYWRLIYNVARKSGLS